MCMSTTSVGREAENSVAEQLKKQGYLLIEQNWRTKWCEIDLIMSKKRVVYFIEVKYRSSDKYGSGLEYITPKKLQQMRFAAEMWLSCSNWVGGSQLAVAELTGEHKPVEIIELV